MTEIILFCIVAASIIILTASIVIHIIVKYDVTPGWMIDDPENEWVFEYTADVKPECFERSEDVKRRCGGTSDIKNFVCNDCTTCKYWIGNP